MSTHAFVNKLWNAGKFILLNLEQVHEGGEEWAALSSASFSQPSSFAHLPLTERWVLSSLHEVGASDCHLVLQAAPSICSCRSIVVGIIKPASTFALSLACADLSIRLFPVGPC